MDSESPRKPPSSRNLNRSRAESGLFERRRLWLAVLSGLVLLNGRPSILAAFNMHAAPPGTAGKVLAAVDAAERRRVIDGVIANLKE